MLSIVDLLIFPTEMAFYGNQFRLQGILLLWFLLLFSFLSKQFSVEKLPLWVPFTTLLLLVVSAFFLGANESGRAIGTLGEPNAFGSVLVAIWPFIFFHKNSVTFRQKTLIKTISLVIVIIGLFICGSRAALFGLFLQMLFIGLVQIKRISIQKASWISLFIVCLTLFLPFFENRIFENRGEVWVTAAHAGLQKPFLGWGIGNIEIALKETAHTLSNNLRWQYVDSAHNVLLDWWVQGGIIGLALMGILFLFTVRNMVQKARTLELAVVIGLVATMLFNPVSVASLIFFWWLMGYTSDYDLVR